MTPQITRELYTRYVKGDNHRANINIPQNRITWLPTKGGHHSVRPRAPQNRPSRGVFCEAPHAHCEPPGEWDVFEHCGSQWRKITRTMRPASIIRQIMMRERLPGFCGWGFGCFSIDFYVWMESVRSALIRVIRYFMNYAYGEDTIQFFFRARRSTRVYKKVFEYKGDAYEGKSNICPLKSPIWPTSVSSICSILNNNCINNKKIYFHPNFL